MHKCKCSFLLGKQLVHSDQKESRACGRRYKLWWWGFVEMVFFHIHLQWEARSLAKTHCGGGIQHDTKITSSSRKKLLNFLCSERASFWHMRHRSTTVTCHMEYFFHQAVKTKYSFKTENFQWFVLGRVLVCDI